MNILLISQCEKRALTETRRILDQFAERRGERVWQTPITQAGLDTLRKLLRKTARKNTAVACHWIRGLDHSELIWIVGDASRFNAQGAVPTNTTRNDILRSKDENDWHTLEDIRLLAQMAALLHDLGKASNGFQAKLKNSSREADAFRHEWISLRLFEAFAGAIPNDSDWLGRLADLEEPTDTDWLKRLQRDGVDSTSNAVPLKSLPPLAQIIGWLMLTHHRLPYGEIRNAATLSSLPGPIKPDWCGARGDADKRQQQSCWKFSKGLPFASKTWRRKVASCAKHLLARQASLKDWLKDPYVMHLARLALMLADHHYSSQEAHPLGDADFPLYANTDKNRDLKQKLDEHLIGVAHSACQLLSLLPRLGHQLGHLANHKGFTRRTIDKRFRWQDKAFDTTTAIAERTRQQGFFGINMASTGCGKTLANARILYALADARRGMRATIALGLRTLTLQTGQAYRDRLSLDDDELAVLVGNATVRKLFNLEQQQSASSSGSESSDELLLENCHVHYSSNLEDSVLKDWLGHNSDALRLLQAPLLTCTIDHLMPATESLRGGHQIAPMLRLMTSDLVLDEPDDFDIDDLPALSRLVHWAGLLGCRVLLSSATLPPALIEGLFEAYRKGRAVFQRHRGEAPGRQPDIVCAWFDEFNSQSQDCPEPAAFTQAHQQFVTRRLVQLEKSPTRRRARLVPLPPETDLSICQELARQLPKWMQELHRDNHTEHQGKRVSFGLVRLAHIDPIIEIARTLLAQDAPEGLRIHLCVYHSRHPLLMRSHIERELDMLLKRADNDAESQFQKEQIRRALLQHPQDDHLFVVLASPVTEVGRDHDYDWAIVEPSSMRSIIQLAGRIRRHRTAACDNINIYLLEQNLWSLEGKDVPYCRPGFESKDFRLKNHNLNNLLDPEQLEHLDARSRISEPVPLRAQDRLVDLEHHRLRTLLHRDQDNADTLSTPLWWETPAWLTGVLQHNQPFRDDKDDKRPEIRYVLLPDENDSGKLDFRADDPGDEPGQRWIDCNKLLHEYEIRLGQGITHWGSGGYLQTIDEEARHHDFEPLAYARRFGEVRLKTSKTNWDGWDYHWALGFQERK
ncbi:type I-F CRISPR-associated helicase Cas3 [Betaproteobacteria bacterium]|nr:type I-F CRISPR-associated helicase Cas3 [Betaproteobacteria bacterium]GHT99912.1 type I-F CRISPR-associated helicase Cas3 [Betaproteobacteria bacterium]GHU23403.1 type I-F CRISPR-associated helicase Cas3 [Betaproteobacteria bacterium]